MTAFLTIALPPLLLVIFAVAASYFYQRLESRLSRSVLSPPRSEGVAPSQASGRATPQDHLPSFRDYVYAFTIGAKPSDISSVNRVWERLLAEEQATDIILFGLTPSAFVLKGRQFEEQHLFAAPVADITAVMKRKTSQFYKVLESGEAEKFYIGPLATSHVFEESAANSPALAALAE